MPLTRLLGLLWLLLAAQTAHAACATTASATADLGNRTSYDVRGGSVPAVATSPTLTCIGGSLLSILSTDHARATFTSTGNFRLRSAAGDTIGYKLSPDSAGNLTVSQGGSVNYLDPGFISLLGLLSATSLAPPLYATLTETPNVPAGTYTDTVTIAWSWSICRGVGLGLGGVSICVLEDRGTGTSTLTVSVVVTKDCRISAPPVAFGSAPLARGFAPVTQAVAVDCTKGASFAIGFTAGTSGASRPWRQMRDGQGHSLRYNLYRPDGATIWDETNPLASVTIGSGAVTPTLLHTYVAKVDPDQATPPAGAYTDTVSVVVSF